MIDAAPTAISSSERWARVDRIILAALATAVVGLVVALLLTYATDSAPSFAPIAFAPEPRHVERIDPATGIVTVPRVDGVTGPAVHVDETVPTTGTRCNNFDEPVAVTGSVWWERLDRLGVRIHTVRDFPATVDPGCLPIEFENEIPLPVADRVRLEDVPQLWRIVGSTTPTRPGGVPAVWSIEPFWIVP